MESHWGVDELKALFLNIMLSEKKRDSLRYIFFSVLLPCQNDITLKVLGVGYSHLRPK